MQKNQKKILKLSLIFLSNHSNEIFILCNKPINSLTLTKCIFKWAKSDACAVEHDEFLTLAYYNCESKIFKRLSSVPLTGTSAGTGAWARGSRTAPTILRLRRRRENYKPLCCTIPRPWAFIKTWLAAYFCIIILCYTEAGANDALKCT